jgi:carbamoyltransferase
MPTPGDGAIRHADKLAGTLRYGSVAVQVDAAFAARYPGAVSPDGRALLQRVEADPTMERTLSALHRRTGVAAGGLFARAEGEEPPVAGPGDAIRVWRRTGLDALLIGPFLVQKDT